jgi:UDP-N-acetylglucosamine 4,6-dehydratase/5-epimerase
MPPSIAASQRMLALSTDKAVNPVNLYGATKLCAEKVLCAGECLRPRRSKRASVARAMATCGQPGQRHSGFLEQRKRGRITDHRSPHDTLLAHAGTRASAL